MVVELFGIYDALLKVRDVYWEISEEIDKNLREKKGLAGYYFPPFHRPSKLDRKWPPPSGLLTSLDRLTKFHKRYLWNTLRIHQPRYADLYIGISAHLEPNKIENVIRLGFEKTDAGVILELKEEPGSYRFEPLSVNALGKYLLSYEFPRDFYVWKEKMKT